MKDRISIGLLGLGTVGSGVVKLVQNHQEQLVHQLGCSLSIQKVLVRDLDKERNVDIQRDILTTDYKEVVLNPEIDIVVEVMGGIEETKKYILEAFQAKKHVVTANKDLIAVYGSELQDAAMANGCDLFYEASVAGGIPIIRGLADGLASDKIEKLMGIVNGTTNYILTKMDKEGLSYETALQNAQKLGYAEADPTADVEGLDAARKMAILSRLAFSMDIHLEDVEVTGISKITKEDLKYGDMLGYTMKLIGYAHQINGKAEVSVQPTFLSKNHPLSCVQDEYNAVYVYGEAVGETMFYGPGAGSLPTATSVVSDVVAVVKNMRLGVNGKNSLLPQYKKNLKTDDERFAKYFIRLHVHDEIGAFSELTKLFSAHTISFEKILQLPLEEKGLAEIVIVTHKATIKNFQSVLQHIQDLPVVKGIQSFYRVEGDGLQ